MSDLDACERHDLINCTDCNPPIALPTLRISDRALRPESTDYRRWSPVEHSIAEDLAYTDAEVAELLDRAPKAVHLYRLAKGIITKAHERNLDYDAVRMMARWTPDEDEYLATHKGDSMDELVLALGRSAIAIRARLYKKG